MHLIREMNMHGFQPADESETTYGAWTRANLSQHNKTRLNNVKRVLRKAQLDKLPPGDLYEALLKPLRNSRHSLESLTDPDVALVLAELLDKLTPRNENFLDPAVGAGSVLAALSIRRPDISMVGIDRASIIGLPGEIIARATGTSVRLFKGDILATDPKALVGDMHPNGFYTIFVQPPIGLRLPTEELGRWFELAQNRSTAFSESLFLETALSALRPGGYLVALMPTSILFRQSDAPTRQYLLQESYPELIAEFPSLFLGTGVSSALLVLRKKGPEITPGSEVLMATRADDPKDNAIQALREVVDAFLTNLESTKEGA
jgi:type I restriction-modification system DNA methylase subunit